MMVSMQREVENKRLKLNSGTNINPVVLNNIKIGVAKDFFINKIEKGEIIPSLFCAYFKTFFILQIYQAFGLSLDGFSITEGNNFYEKSKKKFKNIQNYFGFFVFSSYA